MNSPSDTINHRTMKTAVKHYAAASGIGRAEKNAFASIAREFSGKRILDLGVGGGRTVNSLLEISRDYVGADYVQEMVDHCRDRYPHARFELADARAMPQFENHSFDVIVFAWAGICMVNHEGRLAILREIRRLLSPHGVFIFSTFNRNSREHGRWFRFPDFHWPKSLTRLPEAGARYLARTLICVGNRLRHLRHEKATQEYSIINDQFHEYRTMHYYITFDEQLKQLAAHGFGQCTGYDAAGNPVTHDHGELGDAMLLVARA
jgi:ubiquinone/menaquinone biosynthesis C-methylase UbiE